MSRPPKLPLKSGRWERGVPSDPTTFGKSSVAARNCIRLKNRNHFRSGQKWGRTSHIEKSTVRGSGYSQGGKEAAPAGRVSSPTIIEQTSAAVAQAAKAKQWRKNVVKLSRRELATQLGYSEKAITFFERGYDLRGKSLSERAVKRYRLACEGLRAGALDQDVGDLHGEGNAVPDVARKRE